MIPPEADPVAFVRTALDALPTDPAAATQADLQLLAAANEGLTRPTAAIHADVSALTRRLLNGALISDLADEHTRLEALCANAERRRSPTCHVQRRRHEGERHKHRPAPRWRLRKGRFT
jgi:hypothetical protein